MLAAPVPIGSSIPPLQRLSFFLRTLFLMKQNETMHPIRTALLCADAVMLRAHTEPRGYWERHPLNFGFA